MTQVPPPDLTVVIAAVDADRHLRQCLHALSSGCADVRTEILVVGSFDGEAWPEAQGVTYVNASAGRLTPELWADGIRRATGRVVALTTAHFAVAPGWGQALVQAFTRDVAAAGGPVRLGTDTGPVDWAIFFLRYSAFLAANWGNGPTDEELAGDNAAYRREDLLRHAATFDRGFWEVDFHRRLRADGLTLTRVSEASAAYGRSFRVRTFVAQRFAHGREFGAGDVAAGRRSRARLMLFAPAVPFVMALRAGRRVGWTSDLLRLTGGLPMFLLFASAWAAGEFMGACRPQPGLRHRAAGDLA